MNAMEPPVDAPPDAASGSPDEASISRRSMITVGVPAVLAVVAVGAVPFVFGTGDERISTNGTETPLPTDRATTTAVPDDIFTSTGVTVEDTPILPGSTSSTTTSSTTTTSTTTTLPPTTLPAQPSQPAPPPPDPRGYEEQTQLGGIAIPKLGVDAPLLEGIRLTTLDNGPGHWPGTAMPGQIGNVVVAAHRTSHGGPFRNIDQLVAGDAVMFTTDAGEIPVSRHRNADRESGCDVDRRPDRDTHGHALRVPSPWLGGAADRRAPRTRRLNIVAIRG